MVSSDTGRPIRGLYTTHLGSDTSEFLIPNLYTASILKRHIHTRACAAHVDEPTLKLDSAERKCSDVVMAYIVMAIYSCGLPHTAAT